MGGKASAEARRARKTLREELLFLLSQEVHDKNGKPITVNESVCMAMLKERQKG